MKTDPGNRILIIDDNRAIHDDFRKIFCPKPNDMDRIEAEFFGDSALAFERPVFEVDSAYQGEEGVAMLRAALEAGRPYAVAFVDVRMPPGIDGVETAEWLCQLSPELQVVICSAYSDYSWEQMLQRLGCSDRLLILKKPFAAIEALQMACALTEKWRMSREIMHRLVVSERVNAARKMKLQAANDRLVSEIKERRDMECQLLRTQRLESIGTLASGLAHDLGNTLGTIVTCLPLLCTELPKGQRDEIISTVQLGAEAATEVLKQLLTFARGTDGERVAIDPAILLSQAAKVSEQTLPETIETLCTAPEGLWTVEGDHTQLYQALINLCLNARDAMPAGGTLRLEAENVEVDESRARLTKKAHAGPHVRFRVSDNGCGIEDDLIEKIFDPFFTTKPAGKGTGLGLSTTLGIIRGHNGFVEVHSVPGCGTAFDLYLPAVVEPAAVRLGASASAPVEATPALAAD